MADNDIALMAHLMRRAGFGAQYDELTERASEGYEATVEELLNPSEETHGMDLDLAERSFLEWNHFIRCVPEYIAWRMINSRNQLEEKMVLFWHGILCTADSKTQSYVTSQAELDMLRRNGMGNFRDLLMEISKDPAMIYFLDNCLSHKEAINENYGRELLELFSMGVGMEGQFNYTEDDVKECARAFTGWTIANNIPGQPYGRYPSQFVFNPEDHDEGDKTFLGETGNFNGEDVVDIIANSPLPPASSPATCTTSLWLMRPRCRPGWTLRRGTWPPLRCSRMNITAPATTSSPCCGYCSTRTPSRTPDSPGSRGR